MRESDWKFWLGFRDVAVWQACALSLGIDPDTINYDHMADHFFFRGAVSPVRQEKFKKRLRVLESHFGHRKRPLTDVVKLAVNDLHWEVPDELTPLAREAPAATRVEAAQPPKPDLSKTDTRNDSPKSPPQRRRFQEQEILRAIRELELDPKALPKATPGKPGVKAQVRARLKYTSSVFDKAWERCRNQGDIKEAK